MKVGILAGETSGDALGAGLMAELKKRAPDIEFIGVGGPAMLEQGLVSLARIEQFQVNGFKEPIQKLPELLGLFNRLTRELSAAELDVFVGVDFNVFNLLLERRLKNRGIRTVHYVSPSVYAWRRGRINRIGRSADLVLTLYPFEPAFYLNKGIDAHHVGHPLADRVGFDDSDAAARNASRSRLGMPADDFAVALLPGSRMSEVRLHSEIFFATAARVAELEPDVRFVVPCVNKRIGALIKEFIDASGMPERFSTYEGNGRDALTACDVALVKSGTSTLEALLLKRPMVVTYRLGWATYHIVSRVLRTDFVALPNILAGRELVPELLQYDGTPDRLANALLEQRAAFESGTLSQEFDAIHRTLRKNADFEAAAAVFDLMTGVGRTA